MSDFELDKTPIATKRAREASVGEDEEHQRTVEKAEQQPTGNSEVAVDPKEHVSTITQLQEQHRNVGEAWCLIAKSWWNRWTKYCARLSSPGARKLGESTAPGPIDNRPILDDDNNLREGLEMDVHVVAVPEEAWHKLVSWYGTSTPEMKEPVQRLLVPPDDSNDSEQKPTVELYPPQFQVYMVETTDKSPNHQQITGLTRSPLITLSRANTAQEFCNAIREAFDIPVDADVQYYVLEAEPAMASCPNVAVEVVKNAQKLTVESADTKLSCEGKYYIAIELKDKTTGRFPSDSMEAASTASYPQQLPSPSDTSSDISSTSSVFANGFNNLSTSSAAAAFAPPPPIPIQRFKPGVCGLQNLGNTCFMNSALQCLSNTEELTKWFLADNYRKDLNRDNPLGMKGQVAEAYGELIEKLWSGSASHVAPRDFKYTIGRFNSSFSGYQQHDTQELLAFLLDGLHEDLNRILKKPYIELPDFNDMEDAEIAKQSWDYHKARNDSVIVDLFQGQFKSKLVCAECKNVSMTFDPFMYLSLPLPIKKKSKTTIVYVPYDPTQKLQRVVVTLGKEASIGHLQKEVARMFSVEDPNSLLVAEIFSHKLYKIFAQYEPVASIGASDIIYVYQLPGPVPPTPKKKARFSYSNNTSSDDEQPVADENQLIVFPVYCATVTKTDSTYTNERISQFGDPIILAVPYKDACNKPVDYFYQLISEHIERYSQFKLFEEVIDEVTDDEQQPVALNNDEPYEKDTENTSEEAPVDQQLPPSYEIVMQENATDPTTASTAEEAFFTPSEETEMDIDSDKLNGKTDVDTMQTVAAVTAAGGKKVEPINNLFVMKIFSNTRYSRYGDDDLLPMVQSFTGLVDFHERAKSEQAQREEFYEQQKKSINGTDEDQEQQQDIEMAESPLLVPQHTSTADNFETPATATTEDDQVEDAAAMFGLSSSAINSGVSSVLNNDDKAESGEVVNDISSTSSIDNASIIAPSDSNLSPLTHSPPLEHQPPTPPSIDIPPKLPKRKVTRPPDAIIRQGEGIVVTWTPKRAQQLFGSSNNGSSSKSSYSYSFGGSDGPGVCTDAWEDINDLGDPNAEDEDMTNGKKQVTLSDCLDEFTKEEELSEEDLWYCPKCKKHQRATKKFDLWRMPEIMVVHLKRFSHSRTFRDKIDAFIDFPAEGLDLTDRVLSTKDNVHENDDQDNRLIYDLYAVDNHYGGLGGGHYTSFAQNFEDGNWYNFDDSHVSKVDVNDARTSAAYLLFYKRRRSAKANIKSVEEIMQEKDERHQQQQAAEKEEVERREKLRERQVPTVLSTTVSSTEENGSASASDEVSTNQLPEKPNLEEETSGFDAASNHTESPVIAPYRSTVDEMNGETEKMDETEVEHTLNSLD